MKEFQFPTMREQLAAYVERIASLRQRAGDGPRNTYAVALGQLRALDLIEEKEYREAMERPRIEQ
jgi:hypothetical protein